MQIKPDYGIDAPGVIRNLALVGVAGIVLSPFIPPISIGHVTVFFSGMFLGTGVLCLIEAILMILYAKWGKFRHRDRMLNMIAWKGNEQVLDVGTGRGLLLVSAARKLTSGKAVGIDIWNTEDLSGNSLERTQANIACEGVTEKTELRSENARTMSFADGSFDIVVSNLCLHNIYVREGRAEACREIARVLKPGGLAVISDYKCTGEYAKVFRECGLAVERSGISFLFTFPPLRIVRARKADIAQ